MSETEERVRPADAEMLLSIAGLYDAFEESEVPARLRALADVLEWVERCYRRGYTDPESEVEDQLRDVAATLSGSDWHAPETDEDS